MSAPAWHPLTGKHVSNPVCPCEQGACGHCTAGDHAACPWLRDPAEAARIDARPAQVWLIDRKGYVPTFPDSRGTVARVYLDQAGAHTWRCTCHVEGHGLRTATEGQLDLFGEVAP